MSNKIQLELRNGKEPELILVAHSVEFFDDRIEVAHDTAPLVILIQEGDFHYGGTYYAFCRVRSKV